jgi:hypothetical protein
MIRYRAPNGTIVEVEGALFSSVKDRNGREIVEGDTLRFVDKWEWWRGQFGGGWLATEEQRQEVLHDHEKFPYEDRVIKLPEAYEWLLGTSEIQTYWEVLEDTDTHECDGTNCPPRAHDHKVVL